MRNKNACMYLVSSPGKRDWTLSITNVFRHLIISQFNAMLKFGTFSFAFVLSLFFLIVVLIGLLTNGLFKISILPAVYKVWF